MAVIGPVPPGGRVKEPPPSRLAEGLFIWLWRAASCWECSGPDAVEVKRTAHRRCLVGVTTAGGASTSGFGALLASNWLAFTNITLQRLQAWNGVS